jgi:hypothetical protein
MIQVFNTQSSVWTVDDEEKTFTRRPIVEDEPHIGSLPYEVTDGHMKFEKAMKVNKVVPRVLFTGDDLPGGYVMTGDMGDQVFHSIGFGDDPTIEMNAI